MQAEGEARFKTLAEQALLKSQQQFVQIADETLKKRRTEGAEGELGKMLKPIQESFGQFREKAEAIQKERLEDRAKLSEQIKLGPRQRAQTEMAAGVARHRALLHQGAAGWGGDAPATCSRWQACRNTPISVSRPRTRWEEAASGRMSSSACLVGVNW